MKRSVLERLSRLPSAHLLRVAIALVMLWIGALKFVPYEAEGIVPMVANSPFMSFFYAHPAPEYRAHWARRATSSRRTSPGTSRTTPTRSPWASASSS